MLDSLAALDPAPIVLQTNQYLIGGQGENVPETFIADLEPDGSEGTILIEIDQATRSYAVSYRDTTFVLATKNRGLPGPPVVIEKRLPDASRTRPPQ
jgi:hypothetical protein